MTKIRCSTAIASTTLALLLAGCAADATPDARATEDDAVTAAACSRPPVEGDAPYAFFLVTAPRRGPLRAHALNGAPVDCGDGRVSDACAIDRVDLSALALADRDAATILSELRPDPTAATLLFTGRVVQGDRGRSLRVEEVWRAPSPSPIRGRWLHVSHGATQALVVNRWRSSTVTALDLSRAPTMEYCTINDDDPICAQGHDGVLEDAKQPAGLVVAGWQSDDGVVHATQYFLEIGVGAAHLKNGYWYCRANQIECDSHWCVDDEHRCHIHPWHGRGLITSYQRTDAEPVQPWLVSTSQLTADESAHRPVF